MKSRFPFPGNLDPHLRDSDSAFADIAEAVGRYLKPGERILDFGAGSCAKTAILQILGYRCAAYDDLQDDWHTIPGNRDKIIAFARSCGIDFRLAEGGPLPFERDAFDMVMLLEVLEHLHASPRGLLNDLLETLRPEGLLLVTVPNAANIRKRLDLLRGRTNLPAYRTFYWYPGPWRGHVREYVRHDLEQMARFLGVEVLELRGVDHMLEKVPRPLRGVYKAVTAVAQGWKDTWMLVARKPAGWRPRRDLPEEELRAMLSPVAGYRDA